eukprot:GILK01005008.1.p1 GENE.GILK01005008.1~~GILK01005008.1.p1  ORF type:complete len:2608 (-),score=498.63 GILK01005008.1:139-7962(-)
MGGFQQLGILLWKNSVIKRRHCGVTCCELLLPGFFLLILALIRSRISKDDIPDMFYVGKTVTLNQYSSFDTQNLANNCATLGQKFLVAPGTAGGSEIGNDFATYLQGYASDFSSVISFMSSAAAMDSYVTDAAYGLASNPRVCGGIVFTSSANNQWDYSLRFNTSQRADRSVPLTTLNVDIIDRAAQLKNQDQYINSGFIPMQAAADAFILSRSGASLQQVQVMPFPTPKYKSDSFFSYIATALPIFMVIAFLLPVSRLISGIVLEKESKIREGMRMMGLRDFAFYGSWYITYAIIFLIVAIVLTIVSSVGKVFSNSNPAIIFFYFWLFGLASLAYCFFISVFFSRGKTASTVGVLCFFASFFVFFAVSGDFPHNDKMASSLLPPTAFAHCAAVLGNLEQALIGVTSYSINTEVDNFSFANGISMLVLDFVLYTVLGWYFDHVIPSEFGTSLKPWFFLTPQYWCGDRSMDYDNMHDVDENQNSHRVEPVGENLRQLDAANRCVKIKGLRKEFTTGLGHTKVAVQGLNLSMYEGQIFALLGHNGAGKTTTISMLTGLLNPSAGDATVFGQSIRHHMPDIRKSLGVCPQHDVLFPDLTVREHLWLYAAFKGMKRADIKQAIEQKIADVGLTEKRDVLSKNLSGGMKRKLSVAIALIGDSKLVILDEPTSGMDPFSRRSTWNILKNNKEGRVIILTTHFMDEADILGDRIAIMGDGKLQCCGSSLYLKSRFGVGYCLSMVKDEGCKGRHVTQLVNKYVSDANLLSEVGAEISYQLPLSSSGNFAEMFRELEDRKHELLILSYGISVTTLEEVFLRIARGDFGEREDVQTVRRLSERARNSLGSRTSFTAHLTDSMLRRSQKSIQFEEPQVVVKEPLETEEDYTWKSNMGESLFFRHLFALIRKRYLYSRRDWKALIFELVIPVIVLILGLLLLQNIPFPPRNPYTFSVAKYNDGLPTILPYANLNAVSTAIMDSVSTDLNQVESITIPGQSLQRFSDWILASHLDNQTSRYGAVLWQTATATEVAFTVSHNTTAEHALPVYLNVISNAIYKHYTNNPAASISLSSTPWPVTSREGAERQSISSFSAATIILIAYCFIPGAVVAYIVRERETNVKHQQLVSGVSISGYWISNYFWDVAKYIVPFILSIAVVVAFNVKDMIQGSALGATVLLFWFFGTSVISFTYLLSYLFKSYSNAQNAVIMLNFVSGLLLMIVAYILRLIPSTQEVTKKLVNLFRLLPPFCFGDGLACLTTRSLLAYVGGKPSAPPGAFDWDVTLGGITFMMIESVLYLGIVIALEHSLLKPQFRNMFGGRKERKVVNQIMPEPEDEDVMNERYRVQRLSPMDTVVRCSSIKKVYPTNPPKIAIKELSFGIGNGECFGLLGINGAGKTSAFRILTGEYLPSAGDASIAGADVVTQMAQARRYIGYCPQFDALLELLTAREHLQLYAAIKGIPANKVHQFVEQKLVEMDLVKYADKNAGTFSGGNKRKLSVAIALIGDSKLVILDEPTSGMDPFSRRSTWNILKNNKEGRVIILTTHFMDEADILGDRIAIMGDGDLKCCGSALFLKTHFGVGYCLTMVKDNNCVSDQVQQLVAKYVPDNKVLSDVGAEISFQLPIAASNSFADMFNELEARKAEVRILSYGISVTTLEEVFLKIARGEEGVKESSAIIQSLQKKRSSKMVEMTSVVQVQPAPGSVLQSHQSLQVVKGRKVRPLAHDVDKDYSVANHDPGNMFFKHMRALVKKRYIYSKRDWKALFYELIIPVIVLIAGLGLLKNLASQSRPSLTFGLTNYNPGLQNLLPYDNTIAVSNSIVGSIPSTVGLIQPIDMSSNHTLEYLAQWLLDSHLANKASRYGAYMFNEAASSPSTLNVTIAHNTTGYHSLPTFLNIITDSYLKYKTGDSSASIRTSSMPWPRTNFEQQVSQSFSAFAAATIIMIAYCFIPAAVVAYIVRERETNVKHQHFISGVSANAYWLSHYVWDVVKYMCPFLLSLLVIYLFDIGEYVAGDAFGALTLLFFLFGTSMVSFTYLGSYLFKHYSGAQNATLMLNFVAGLILMLVAFVLRIIPDTSSIANEVVNAFRILPAFCLGDGLANLALRSVYANVAGNAANPKGIFHWDVTSGSIAFMAAESLLYLLLVLAIEHILLHPRFRGTDLSGMCMGDSGAMTRLLDQQLESEHSRNDEDEDVKAERLRVNQLSTTDAVVRVANLKKVYPGSPPKFAVKQLSFAIPNGECFALLGINGAGKTSAFRILTGEYAPTYGEASIGGQDILTDLSGARRLIGYCPQFDALLDLLTAREHLELYANVKGIPSSKIPAFVEQKLEEMNLMEYADRKAGTYSGGNKRKLSVAVAMIGNPPVVFLDEPSTGMDPVSRRFMWDVISRISTERKQSSVILTTHSMEEAEALCSRIGIMVGGTFRCLGSAQHLKNKFGQGYELDIKTQNPTDEQMGPFYDHIRRFIHDDCIAKAQLQNVCESLGRPDRFQRIAERGTGAFIYAQLRKDDRVNARIFLEWWIIEDFAQNVEAFVLQNFAGAVCLEHHASFSRFRLPQTNFNLAQVFGILNSHKDALFVSEYSLSQTTLEQIFNSFAAQQEEEKLEVAGMFFQHNPDRGAHQA